MNPQTDNIKAAISSAQMLVVRLKNLAKLEQADPHYADFKRVAQADLHQLNYFLQTVL